MDGDCSLLITAVKQLFILTWCSSPRRPSRPGRVRPCARSSACRRARRGSGRWVRGSASSGSQRPSAGSAPGTAQPTVTHTVLLQVRGSGSNLRPTPGSPHLSGVLVLYPGADVRVQREVWGKVLKVLCGHRGGEKKVSGHFLNC